MLTSSDDGNGMSYDHSNFRPMPKISALYSLVIVNKENGVATA